MSDRIDTNIVYDLATVGAPAISPDGASVAYIRRQVDRDSAEGDARIELIPFSGGGAKRLTQGPRDGAPLWSPDGSQLAFLRAAGAKSPRQLWLLPTDGGEARQLTDLPYAIETAVWLPDGSALIAVVDVDPSRLTPDEDLPRTTVIRDIYYRGDALGYRVDAWHHLFRIDAQTGAATQLTFGEATDAHPTVSPDGRWIAFASDRGPDHRQRRPFGSELCVVAVDGGHVERLTPGVMSVGKACWSPDGSELAVSITLADQRHQAYLYRVARYGGRMTRLTSDALNPQSGFFPLAPPPPMRWSDDGITFAADARGRSLIVRADPGGCDQITTIRAEGETVAGLDISADGSQIAVVATTPDRPGELIALTADGGATTQLTDVSAPYIASHPPGAVEIDTLERDGWQIPYGVMYPPDFDPSRRYPLVMEIHGGPNGAFMESFNVMHQLLAADGNIVLFVNPRGSSTYGADFTGAVTRDWGGEDSLDLLHVLSHVAARDYVDDQRMGVHGYSYGGYMTTWLIGHGAPFKAAVAGAPVVNLVSMFGTSDISASWGSYQWGGRPSDSDEVVSWYRERSPITHASSVRVPVLILHGEADHRVPISQGEEYFAVLRDLGRRVEFVRFPGCSHLMLRVGHPELQREYYDRMTSWFRRWLQPPQV